MTDKPQTLSASEARRLAMTAPNMLVEAYIKILRIHQEIVRERDELKAEREKVASGKITCADCNSILARW